MPVSSLDLSVFSADREVREDEEAVRVIGTRFPDFSTEEAEICSKCLNQHHTSIFERLSSKNSYQVAQHEL